MSSRENKSRRTANQLKDWGDRDVVVSNPLAKEMKDAAKHIEWLELIVTGLSHKDRNTICKIERHRKRLESMVLLRDQKLNEKDAVIKHLKQELKDTHKNWEIEVQGMEKEKKELTPELRDEAEKEFIKNLQTCDQRMRAKRTAYLRGQGEHYTINSATDGGWKQVFHDYQK